MFSVVISINLVQFIIKTIQLLYIYYNVSDPYEFCQTLGLVLRLRVDFVLPLSQQEQEEQEEQQEEQPLTKIYQKGVY